MPFHTGLQSGLQNFFGLTQQQPSFAGALQQANPNAQFTPGQGFGQNPLGQGFGQGPQQDLFGGIGLQLGPGQDLAVGTPNIQNNPLGFLGQLDQFLDSNLGETLLDFGQGSLAAALGGQQQGLPQPVGGSNFPIPQGFSPQQALLQVLGLT